MPPTQHSLKGLNAAGASMVCSGVRAAAVETPSPPAGAVAVVYFPPLAQEKTHCANVLERRPSEPSVLWRMTTSCIGAAFQHPEGLQMVV